MKDMVKFVMWVNGFEYGFFEYMTAGIPKIAGYRYGALLLSLLLERPYIELASEDMVDLHILVLQQLRQIYLGQITDEKPEDDSVSEVKCTKLWQSPVKFSWRPLKGRATSNAGVREEKEIMTALASAFENWVDDLSIQPTPHNQIVLHRLPVLMDMLLSTLELWDVYLDFLTPPETYRGLPQMLLQISASTWLKLKVHGGRPSDATNGHKDLLRKAPRFRVLYLDWGLEVRFAQDLDTSICDRLDELLFGNEGCEDLLSRAECKEAIIEAILSTNTTELSKLERDFALAYIKIYPEYPETT